MAKVIRVDSVKDFVEQAHSLTGIPKERLYFHVGYNLGFRHSSDCDSDNSFCCTDDCLIFLDSVCPYFDLDKEAEEDDLSLFNNQHWSSCFSYDNYNNEDSQDD